MLKSLGIVKKAKSLRICCCLSNLGYVLLTQSERLEKIEVVNFAQILQKKTNVALRSLK